MTTHINTGLNYLKLRTRIPECFQRKWQSLRQTFVEAWKWFSSNYPAIANHLFNFKDKAIKRFDKGDYWWEMRACDYYQEFAKPKISFLKFQVKPMFTHDKEGYILNSAGFIIPSEDKVLLGIMNSNLGWYLISNLCTEIKNGYQLIWDYFKKFPIKKIDEQNKSEKSLHDEIVQLVETMLQLQQQKQAATLPNQQQQLEQRISYTDTKINEKVYTLYGLTAEEIKLVEGT